MYLEYSHRLIKYLYSAEVEWPGLVNAMSGLVCAHLNDIGPPSTYQPHYSFQPQGAIIGEGVNA